MRGSFVDLNIFDLGEGAAGDEQFPVVGILFVADDATVGENVAFAFDGENFGGIEEEDFLALLEDPGFAEESEILGAELVAGHHLAAGDEMKAFEQGEGQEQSAKESE